MKAFQTHNLYTPEGQRIGWKVANVEYLNDDSEVYHVYFFDVDRYICGHLEIPAFGRVPDEEDVYDAYAAGGYKDLSIGHKDVVALKEFVESETLKGKLGLFPEANWRF